MIYDDCFQWHIKTKVKMTTQMMHKLSHYQYLWDQLATQFPSVDEETLADTLEGMTDLHEMIRSARRAQQNARLGQTALRNVAAAVAACRGFRRRRSGVPTEFATAGAFGATCVSGAPKSSGGRGAGTGCRRGRRGDLVAAALGDAIRPARDGARPGRRDCRGSSDNPAAGAGIAASRSAPGA